MNKQTANTFFMFPPSTEYAGFYQQLLRGIGSYQQLGNRLIQMGEQAHAFRQFDKVKEIGQLLSHIPVKDYQSIGYYFLAVAANSKGNGDQEQARKLYELAATTAPPQYKAKAILSLAAVSFNTRDFESAFYYYQKAIKAGQLSVVSVQAIRGMALLKSIEGYHNHALKDLESVLPIAKYAQPHNYYDYLNSYAVELGEVGRKSEARNVIRHVIASPFIHAYPEWRETADELKEPNRSFIAIPLIEPEPIEVETIETHHASEPAQPSPVLPFRHLKEAPPPQKPDRLGPQEISSLSLSEKRELVLAAIRTGELGSFDYDKLMVMVGLYKLGPADKVLDLEDEDTLYEIVIMWANQVDPEELAAVMSVLRDCKDDKRRNAIIDRIIRIAFEESHECGATEEAWRMRVERRLPEK